VLSISFFDFLFIVDPTSYPELRRSSRHLQSLKNNEPIRLPEVSAMAHPIELGLVLEGEDAEEFLEDLRNPKATKEQIEMFKEAIELFKEHPF
jgi:hypothetical protein